MVLDVRVSEDRRGWVGEPLDEWQAPVDRRVQVFGRRNRPWEVVGEGFSEAGILSAAGERTFHFWVLRDRASGAVAFASTGEATAFAGVSLPPSRYQGAQLAA